MSEMIIDPEFEINQRVKVKSASMKEPVFGSIIGIHASMIKEYNIAGVVIVTTYLYDIEVNSNRSVMTEINEDYIFDDNDEII